MMKVATFKLIAVPMLSVLASCQHLPGGFPYTVTDDCRVRVADAAPEPGSGFSFGIGGVVPFGRPGVPAPRPKAAPAVDGNARPGAAPERRSMGGGGFGMGFPILLPTAQPDIAQDLLDNGPEFPAQFSMSCMPIKGFVRGGWPVVIDYQPSGEGNVVLEIHHPGNAEPYVLNLDATARRQIMKIDLPDAMGETPQAALFLVKATKRDADTAAGMQLFGMGAGPKAVGSVAIDQVDFSPGALRVSRKQTASYRFFSRSDFNRAVVEVLRYQKRADEINVALARSTTISNGISRGIWVGKSEPHTWDGRDQQNQISIGPHGLQVRAWSSAQNERDWVVAWSPNRVEVSD